MICPPDKPSAWRENAGQRPRSAEFSCPLSPFRKIHETIFTKPLIVYIGALNGLMKKIYLLLVSITIGAQLLAQSKTTMLPPALSAIREADLKKDIFELAGDAFRGRRAGTIDEMRAAAWVAQKAHEAGLKPAGEDGTYFQ